MLKTLNKPGFKVLIAGLLLVSMLPASAAAVNLTQGYVTDNQLQNGMIVRLDPKDANKVSVLKRGQIVDMLGVIVSQSDAPLSISNPSSHQVLVATYGKYQALVSNENGVIKPGDFVTISSIDGVGMRSDGNFEVILGKALVGFAGSSDAETRVTLNDNNGGQRRVGIKRIVVDISVAHNPLYNGDAIAGVPRFLSSIVGLVTPKPVTALRIYACLGVLIVAFVMGGGVMYSGINSGMRAVGRNPFAKKSILRNMITAILLALIVVAIGLIAVYLLLRI